MLWRGRATAGTTHATSSSAPAPLAPSAEQSRGAAQPGRTGCRSCIPALLLQGQGWGLWGGDSMEGGMSWYGGDGPVGTCKAGVEGPSASMTEW